MWMPGWCDCPRSNGRVTCWWWFRWRMKQIGSGPWWRPVRTSAASWAPGFGHRGRPVLAAVTYVAELEDQIQTTKVFVEDGHSGTWGERTTASSMMVSCAVSG